MKDFNIHPQTWLGLSIKPYTPNLGYILENVCSILEVPTEKVLSKSKKANLVRARKIFSYICIRKGFTFREAGEIINRDHSTVVHAFKCVDKRKYDWRLKEDFERVAKIMDTSTRL